jgi:hypothetical protein
VNTHDLVVEALREQARAHPRRRLFRQRPTGPVVDRDEELQAEYPELFADREQYQPAES